MNLKHLEFQGCPGLIDQRFLEILKMCNSGLQTLIVYNNTQLTCGGLHDIQGRFPNLQYLRMTMCRKLTDEGLSELLNLCGMRLEYLDVARTNVSGVGLNVPSGKLSNLANLILAGCPLLTDAGLSSLLNLCSDKLTTLDVSEVDISEEFMVNVQESRPGLTIRRF